MAQRLDSDLLRRLREVLAEQPATESELRILSDQAAALARALKGQVAGSERRLSALTREAGSSLAEAAAELRRLETLTPALKEIEGLRVELEQRARQLRTDWLLHQTGVSPPGTSGSPPPRSRAEPGGRPETSGT